MAYMRFEEIDEIQGQAHALDAEGYTMFLCGTKTDKEPDEPYRAQMLRMESDGKVTWYKQFEKSRWLAKGVGSNMCRGLAFHENI